MISSKCHHLGFTHIFFHLKFFRFLSKSFQIFHAASDAHIIATEFISKKLFFIVFI
ncbi:MAG: hypothetical protein Q8S84_01595 [bacterium]|nr:hypothetical protein [bacterium]